jgi:glycosyltransferase involved in cell wall biosynthesis
MDRVNGSMVSRDNRSRVIPNGVDLSVFRRRPMEDARRRLGLPDDAAILLFAANGIRKNVWKDYECMSKALSLVSASFRDRGLIFLALGEDSPDEYVNGALVRFIPYQRDPRIVAAFYQAADLYLHAARAETFPNTVIEALHADSGGGNKSGGHR